MGTAILDVLNSPWAIVPDKLFEITEIYSRHLRGEKIDVAAIEAQIGKPLHHQPKGYQIADGGVAVLPVEGVLAKRMNMMMQFSGGTSMQHLTRDLRQALADPQVSSVILAVDSPGGTVDGTLDVGRAVLEARTSDKPVVAWVDGLMASAAYWISSAADSVYINSGTDMVGSIGVAMQHVDYSGADAQRGIKRTDIYSGSYKRIASDAGPLTPDGRAYLQAQSDYYYSLFVEHVAQQRGVSVDKVLSDMADGRIFIGQQAIDAGLVDGASTLDALIADLANGTYQRQRAPRNATGAVAVARVLLPDASHAASHSPGAGAAPTIEPSIYEEHMDIATLKDKHPDVAKALVDEGFAAGATAERERIQSVEAQALPGHEALIQSLKFDGKTAGPEAAVQVLAAERGKTSGMLASLRQDAPAPAPAQPSQTGDAAGDAAAQAAAADANLPLDDRAKKQFEGSADIRREFQTVERYTGWLKHEEKRQAA